MLVGVGSGGGTTTGEDSDADDTDGAPDPPDPPDVLALREIRNAGGWSGKLTGAAPVLGPNSEDDEGANCAPLLSPNRDEPKEGAREALPTAAAAGGRGALDSLPTAAVTRPAAADGELLGWKPEAWEATENDDDVRLFCGSAAAAAAAAAEVPPASLTTDLPVRAVSDNVTLASLPRDRRLALLLAAAAFPGASARTLLLEIGTAASAELPAALAELAAAAAVDAATNDSGDGRRGGGGETDDAEPLGGLPTLPPALPTLAGVAASWWACSPTAGVDAADVASAAAHAPAPGTATSLDAGVACGGADPPTAAAAAAAAGAGAAAEAVPAAASAAGTSSSRLSRYSRM